MTRSEEPGLVGPSSLAAAAATLAAAFVDYPWTRWVIPEQGYFERLYELQHLYLQHAQTHGIVITTADGAGVAAMLAPGAPMPSDTVVDRIVELHGDRISRLTESQAEPDAWTLETLGVCSEARGAGVGSELIRLALEAIVARGATRISLDTSDSRNVELYKRHGFTVVGHESPDVGPPSWRMRADLPERG